MTSRNRSARDAALAIVETLHLRGFMALLAGGCVRDKLLGLSPKDYDVATDATPEQVAEVFPKVRRVGAKFGVMLVRKFGHEIEVATFRVDGVYTDGRRPDSVQFGTAEMDARRRDFTINGLFLDPFKDQIIDYVQGRADLEAGVIRTIGQADKRFTEDHLRMLRAVRFAARLGFVIENQTFVALKNHAVKLSTISPERIWGELELILREPTRAAGWKFLVETGLRDHLAGPWQTRSADEEKRVTLRMHALPARSLPAALALAAALCDGTPDEAVSIGLALRVSNRINQSVRWLIASLATLEHSENLELADLKRCMAHEQWSSLLELFRADLTARAKSLAPYEELIRRAEAIATERIRPPRLLNGNDLSDMGLPPGPEVGRALKALDRAQLNEEISSRDEAIGFLEQWRRSNEPRIGPSQ